MPPTGFETAMPTNERQQKVALDRATTEDSTQITYLTL
jgi:hypothetical protein